MLFLFVTATGKQGQSNRAKLGTLRINNQKKASLRRLQGPQRTKDTASLEKLKEEVRRKMAIKEREIHIQKNKMPTTKTGNVAKYRYCKYC